MSVKLRDIVRLVGTLGDADERGDASRRFREYLRNSVNSTEVLSDYIGECIRGEVDNRDRALQDLVNRCGELIGFNVEYGAYGGAHKEGQIGYDGLWKLRVDEEDWTIVVEVKSLDQWLSPGQLDELVKRVVKREDALPKHAFGLMVVGRVGEDRKTLGSFCDDIYAMYALTIRVSTVKALVTLAEWVNSQKTSAREIVKILRPAEPLLDNIIDIWGLLLPEVAIGDMVAAMSDEHSAAGGALYIVTPLRDDEMSVAEDGLRKFLKKEAYVFAAGTPYRRQIKSGDRICFYISGVGVVAEAEVASEAQERTVEGIEYDEQTYQYAFKLRGVREFFDKPVVIDSDLRSRMNVFLQAKKEGHSWGWFVQATRRVDAQDFSLLVGRPTEPVST